jgi:hypothetical protein
MKNFPQAFTLTDNQHVILEFEKLLLERGLEIPVNSPLEEASLAILEMLETRKNKAVHNLKVDCREKWRQAFFLSDIARKVLRAQQHPDFDKLLSHLKLLLEQSNFSQFSASQLSASPKAKDTNNKVFELFVAVILFQICSNLQFDNPHSSKGDNPDVIGEHNGKKWAFACKVSHSANPKTFLERVREGVAQIEKAKTDRGIVVINLKNLIPHDEIWPATQDAQSGVWSYGAYENSAAPVIQVRLLFREFEQAVYDLVGGRQAFINEFIGKKAVPMVLMFYCTVAGHSPKAGIVQPMIVKQMAGIGVPAEQADSEAAKVIDLFNDYLHDKVG